MDILHIVEQLGIVIKKVTKREIIALCPLHNDKSPSLNINITTGLHQCWAGCTSGDIYTLISNILRISREEAKIRYSNDLLEIDILKSKLNKPSTIDKKSISTSNIYIHIPTSEELSSCGFINAKDCSYLLEQRNLSSKIIEKYGILYNAELATIAIPIEGECGCLAGYIYRWTDEYHIPKVRYSVGFQKNDHLFGIPQVDFELLERRHSLCLVEGEFDVINLRQHGVNAVGLFGCELSDNQLALLRRFDLFIIQLALDNDDAGWIATGKLRKKLGGDFVLWKVLYPGKDPAMLSSKDVDEYFYYGCERV